MGRISSSCPARNYILEYTPYPQHLILYKRDITIMKSNVKTGMHTSMTKIFERLGGDVIDQNTVKFFENGLLNFKFSNFK